MKKIYKISILVVVGAMVLTSCQSKAGTGALIGGGLGTGAGALIGGGLGGAAIGAGLGAITGAVVGDSMEKNGH